MTSNQIPPMPEQPGLPPWSFVLKDLTLSIALLLRAVAGLVGRFAGRPQIAASSPPRNVPRQAEPSQNGIGSAESSRIG